MIKPKIKSPLLDKIFEELDKQDQQDKFNAFGGIQVHYLLNYNLIRFYLAKTLYFEFDDIDDGYKKLILFQAILTLDYFQKPFKRLPDNYFISIAERLIKYFELFLTDESFEDIIKILDRKYEELVYDSNQLDKMLKDNN